MYAMKIPLLRRKKKKGRNINWQDERSDERFYYFLHNLGANDKQIAVLFIFFSKILRDYYNDMFLGNLSEAEIIEIENLAKEKNLNEFEITQMYFKAVELKTGEDLNVKRIEFWEKATDFLVKSTNVMTNVLEELDKIPEKDQENKFEEIFNTTLKKFNFE